MGSSAPADTGVAVVALTLLVLCFGVQIRWEHLYHPLGFACVIATNADAF